MSIITIKDTLKNAGSKLMNVNGSVTPKVFTYSPVSGSAALTKLAVMINSPGTASFTNFGAISALTNGVLIEVVIGGVTTQISNIKDNADLCVVFNPSQFGSSAANTLGIPIGFGSSVAVFVGTLDFPEPMILTDSDQIQVTIRDNLSTITNFLMGFKALVTV